MIRSLFWNATLVFAILAMPFSTFGFHIIGGDLTYVCLGNGDYEFTAHMYRDCFCVNCADMPQVLPISIFECGNNISCQSLEQGDQKFKIDVPILSNKPIFPPNYACYTPPDICVEVGTYKWKLSEYGVTLDNSPEDYIITFQRCCRNSTINNLSLPDRQGATYTTTISSESQQQCNSSAVFDDFPPTVICVGVPLKFDHAATDPDGDTLIYELCAPFQGGGFSSDQTNCNSPAPDPPCPPPYKRVGYGPAFFHLKPLVGDPELKIDSFSGFMTGTPLFQGQFVVGVCVSEIRNGVVINRNFRDFQFNVTECNPIVETLIASDGFDIQKKEFTVEACRGLSVTFQNRSFQTEFIDDHQWRFNIDGQTQIFDEWSPTVDFPRVGTYTGMLVLNPGLECTDSASIVVNVYPEMEPDFEFDYDTCLAGPIAFFDKSVAKDNQIIGWEWRFGGGVIKDLQNPIHEYDEPGVYSILLAVKDTNDCNAFVRKELSYFPLPRDIIVSPSAAIGCQPVEIFFENLTKPIDETYQINWDFGDGGFSDELSPSHLYEEIGTFTVTIDLVSPSGCRTDTVFPNLIKVKEAPIADFSWTPEELTTFNSTAEFTDKSINAARREWLFNQNFRTGEVNPTYTFRETGLQEIQLIAYSLDGCTDTAFAKIDIYPEYTFYLPNAFTPNHDGNNDTYLGVGFFQNAQNYNMTIWNRWGEKIFDSTDPTEGWNGRKFNIGKPSPQDVYMVRVTFDDAKGAPLSFLGQATLVR